MLQSAKLLKSKKKKKKNHITMHVCPWPGDCRLILLQLQRVEEDFWGGCSGRIRVKRSRVFGPPQCYQISADSLAAAPRALEHITSWEGKGRLAEFYVCSAHCTASTCEVLREGQKLSWPCWQSGGDGDKVTPPQGCRSSRGRDAKGECLRGAVRHVWQLHSVSRRKTWWVKMRRQ